MFSKKWAAALAVLFAAMTVALAGCGGKEGDASSQDGGNTSITQDGGTSRADGDTPQPGDITDILPGDGSGMGDGNVSGNASGGHVTP